MGRPFGDSGVTLYVEAAFSAATGSYGVWDAGVWDTATWGPDLIWSDLSGDVLAITAELGRDRAFDHFRSGNDSIVLDNTSGDYSPQNTAGLYAALGVTGIRPWRPIRAYATYSATPGVTYPLLYGFAEDFQDDYSTLVPKMVIPLYDGIAKLAKFDGFEQPAAGGGESAGRRIHRIADNASWTLDRAIDESDTTMQATTLAQNAWTEMLLTADSDGGELWVDPDGTLIFEHAGAPYQQTRKNTSQATFTDSDTPGVLHYDDYVPTFTGDLLVNMARLARAGGTEQYVADNDSRSLYDVDALFSRDDLLCETDAQVLALASRMVSQRAHPEQRVKSFTLRPMIYPELWPHVLGRRIGDRITVEHHHPQTGVLETFECFVDGIKHEIAELEWTTTITTGSAEFFPTADEMGTWDAGLWDSAVWGW
jgi:hypothetical protein